jgi:hypothetical protein
VNWNNILGAQTGSWKVRPVLKWGIRCLASVHLLPRAAFIHSHTMNLILGHPCKLKDRSSWQGLSPSTFYIHLFFIPGPSLPIKNPGTSKKFTVENVLSKMLSYLVRKIISQSESVSLLRQRTDMRVPWGRRRHKTHLIHIWVILGFKMDSLKRCIHLNICTPVFRFSSILISTWDPRFRGCGPK